MLWGKTHATQYLLDAKIMEICMCSRAGGGLAVPIGQDHSAYSLTF